MDLLDFTTLSVFAIDINMYVYAFIARLTYQVTKTLTNPIYILDTLHIDTLNLNKNFIRQYTVSYGHTEGRPISKGWIDGRTFR